MNTPSVTTSIRTTCWQVSYYQDGFEAGACDRAYGYTQDIDALHSHLRDFAQGYIDGYNTGTINEFIPEVLS